MTTYSTDDGRTWAEPRSLPDGIVGPVKNHPLEFPDGMILCGSSTEQDGWRVHFEQMSVALSEDGQNWTQVLVLEDEKGAEFSYPAVLQSRDGLVHVTYTWKRLRIRHAVLDPGR